MPIQKKTGSSVLGFCFPAVLTGIAMFFACGENSVGTQTPAGLSSGTFTAIKAEVFTPKCALSGCHNGPEAPNLRASVAYNNIVNKPSGPGLDYIEPGSSANSYLFKKLTGTGISGTIMPRGASPLSAATIDSIRAWIERGATNN
ncbi:MAG: hypothetical protein FJY97_19450 [candidate division Zixibacteria bacterium]|nr:hypothetical protein [candidate division Zixibacteria bacterium]